MIFSFGRKKKAKHHSMSIWNGFEAKMRKKIQVLVFIQEHQTCVCKSISLLCKLPNSWAIFFEKLSLTHQKCRTRKTFQSTQLNSMSNQMWNIPSLSLKLRFISWDIHFNAMPCYSDSMSFYLGLSLSPHRHRESWCFLTNKSWCDRFHVMIECVRSLFWT